MVYVLVVIGVPCCANSNQALPTLPTCIVVDICRRDGVMWGLSDIGMFKLILVVSVGRWILVACSVR